MGMEQIVARIIDEAREEAARIRADFDDRIQALQARWDEEKALRISEAEAERKSAAARERARILTAERLEARKRRLALKRELVDLAFARARKAFVELPEDEYVRLLARQVAEASLSGDEEVLLGAEEHGRIGRKVVDEANGILKSRGGKADLVLASEPADVDAGAILRKGRVEVRRTVDELVDELREKLEGEVAALLFEGEE